MENILNTKETITTISIEKVSNGFIVKENPPLYDRAGNGEILHCRVIKIKVFNTHSQLNKYINKNL